MRRAKTAAQRGSGGVPCLRRAAGGMGLRGDPLVGLELGCRAATLRREKAASPASRLPRVAARHEPSPVCAPSPSRAQLAALRTLCRSLMQRYGIPKSHIRPHCDVRKGHTDCPGKHFQLPSFISSL